MARAQVAGLALRFVLLEVLLWGSLFVPAGRIDLPWFWAMMGIHLLIVVVGLRLMDRELFQERIHPGPGGKDRWIRWMTAPFFLGHLVVTGLDAGRFHWSGEMAPEVHLLGMAGYVAGMGLSLWAMSVNRFFSPVVRIQQERGHRVVTEGPYRFVRHPGYVGVLLATLFSGPALGSWWAVLVILPVVLVFLRRTVLEDSFLRASLEGYRAYAERVRYRLLPGVW